MKWIEEPCPTLDPTYRKGAVERQSQLTKPPGSLGILEEIAIRLANLQQKNKPCVDQISISVFAADHGIAEEGVSAFPQEVTAQMVLNFLNGGAAISVLANQLDAKLEVIDVGILNALPQQAGLILQRAGNGTANSSKQPAMSLEQLETALQAGFDVIERATENNTQLFIGGEMGIGNTTSAAALYCALLDLTPEQATGAGTGLDASGIQHKIKVVQQVIERHKACGTYGTCQNNAPEWLRCVGGFEIASLTGAYIHAAQSGIPVLVDGFISSAAALCAVRIKPKINEWLFFSHVSAEQGHRLVLEQLLESLNQTPLLDLGMRLGEGSGAAVSVSLLKSACALHNEMATFAEAAVATKL